MCSNTALAPRPSLFLLALRLHAQTLFSSDLLLGSGLLHLLPPFLLHLPLLFLCRRSKLGDLLFQKFGPGGRRNEITRDAGFEVDLLERVVNMVDK